jgi:hypothetical protein
MAAARRSRPSGETRSGPGDEDVVDALDRVVLHGG